MRLSFVKIAFNYNTPDATPWQLPTNEKFRHSAAHAIAVFDRISPHNFRHNLPINSIFQLFSIIEVPRYTGGTVSVTTHPPKAGLLNSADRRYDVSQGILAPVIPVHVPFIDLVEHRRTWRVIKRDVFAYYTVGVNPNRLRSPVLFDIPVCAFVHGRTFSLQPDVGAQAAVSDNGLQIGHMREVHDSSIDKIRHEGTVRPTMPRLGLRVASREEVPERWYWSDPLRFMDPSPVVTLRGAAPHSLWEYRTSVRLEGGFRAVLPDLANSTVDRMHVDRDLESPK